MDKQESGSLQREIDEIGDKIKRLRSELEEAEYVYETLTRRFCIESENE